MLGRIISDRHAGENEVPRDGPRECRDDRANPVAPPSGPADASSNEKKRHWLTEFILAALDEQTAQIKAALMEVSNRSPDAEACLRIVAECQKEAAAFGNHVLERHALHPSLETVDFLAVSIRQLHEQAASLVAGQTHCPLFQPLLDSIAEAAKMAQAKREYLDLEAICPQPLDDLDPAKHEIRQAIQTDDAGKHRKVERTLVPGLIYRGTVLRQAQISIYRHAEQAN